MDNDFGIPELIITIVFLLSIASFFVYTILVIFNSPYDVNGDFRVTQEDLILVEKVAAGAVATPQLMYNCDLNNDAFVNNQDVELMKECLKE